jgi:hypothetical protein
MDTEAPQKDTDMQRLTLTFLTVISLLLGVSAAIGSQATPARADTAIPQYGCPATLYGIAIGGGATYTGTPTGGVRVSTKAELSAAFSAGHKLIELADSAAIDLGESFNVPAGTTIYGYRGINGNKGGLLYTNVTSTTQTWKVYMNLGVGSKLIGIRLQGPDGEISGTNQIVWQGCNLSDQNLIENCELYNWPGAALRTTSSGSNSVRYCYIHNNRKVFSGSASGMGYGCMAGLGTFTLFEACIFDANRHSVAGIAGSPGCSYEARYNRIGPVGNNTCFDAHGGYSNRSIPAGNTIRIHHNTYENTNQPFVGIRGYPEVGVYCNNNWTYMNLAPYVVYAQYLDTTYTPNASAGPATGMFVQDNWYGSTPPPSTNAAPVLNPIGCKSIKEGSTLSFTVSASDADGDALTYSASNLPVGASFNASIRTFSWTPGLSQAGVYAGVRFQVSDGQLTDYEDVTITVIDEVAPVLNAVGNKSVRKGATLSFTISASDANGDALTYSASNLPVGATFNATNRTFSWTPSLSQAGVYTGVRFQVSDGQMTDYEDITITVSDGVQADVNGDGSVNSLDMIGVGQHWNETGESGWIPEDINRDGTVNVLDASLVGQSWTG